MPFPVLGSNSAVAGYEIDNSLRFNDDDSAYLNKTPSSASNRRTWTWSGWFKRSNLGAFQDIFISGSNASGQLSSQFSWNSSDGITLYGAVSGASADYYLVTNALFRDPSAWYHLVLAVDTTQGTNSNRIKLYVNGEQVTSFSSETYPSQNYDTAVNNNVLHTIGRFSVVSANPLDAYLSEVHFIDGSQLTPSSFGETNDNGVWIPKAYDGSYGTNGFYLEFQDSGNLGDDTSGNGNDFTANNLTATDQTTDTPTNNFCTINSVFADAGTNTVSADYSEGNTKLLKTVDAWGHGRGTFLLSSGKWYVEAKVTETGTGETGQFGIVPSVLSGTTDANDKIEGLRVNMGGSNTIFQKMDTGTGSNVFTDFASGDIVMLAIDLDNNKLWVGNDGTWYNNNNASTTLSPSNHDVTLPSNDEGWIFTIGGYRDGGNNLAWEFNWGNPSFTISSSNSDANGYGNMEFAVPSGFYTCCTKNLAEYG